jgi:hypothetical protein
MTAPTSGWQPDPTGRHEYRYWDGTQWTEDVSDGGHTSIDPMPGAPAPTATQATAPQAGAYQQPGAGGYDQHQQPGAGAYGQATRPYGQSAAPYGEYGQQASPYGANPYAPAPHQPSGSGPSTGLLVGLGVLLLVLVVGIAVIITSGGDDDDDGGGGETAGNTEAGTDDGGDDPPPSTTEPDTSGGSETAIADAIATGIVSESNGVLTEEEGRCIADGMVAELGVDRIIELGLDTSGASNPFELLDPDEQTAVLQAIIDCVPADKLAEIGADDAP